ncbi:MAG: CapA family protein [Myxococcaceae bacterium]
MFLGGDLMTGRGVDQLLPHPSDPRLEEPAVRDAREYVSLAEEAHGPVPRPVDYRYIWGEALEVLDRLSPDARIVNLETSVTRSDGFWPAKGINYRMHPENVPCLTAARIDVCVLANNHVLDFGREGLLETLDTLHRAGVMTAGAGRELAEAQRPARLELPAEGAVLTFALALESSGVPPEWAATAERAGVNFLGEVSEGAADAAAASARAEKRPGDVVVASIHWGGNWGYEVPPAHVRFAHRLVDGGVDVVFGHSSHHPRPIEVYRGRLILYGCGDLLDDYEGIAGHEQFRDDLALMYFVTLETGTGALLGLRAVPMQIRNLRLNRASAGDARWMAATLDAISRDFGTRVEVGPDLSLSVR